MKQDRLFHAEGGASFAEVLVAMTLTLTGLVGAMGAFQAAERSIRIRDIGDACSGDGGITD